MTLLIRVILLSLIIFLLIRSFIRYWAEGDNTGQKEERGSTPKKTKKGVPKEIGEYVDYEELKKK
jgi:UDP-N-acetylmuramyl pentapeptide phosphotransferase/UDP-N-acetylglucosamine-1-phosphate transferase